MAGHYQNFKTVVYIPAEVARDFTKEKLSSDLAFLEKYIGLDKVYLESHRTDVDVSEEQLLMIKEFLESKGVEVSGGITTTIDDFEGTEPGKQRLFQTFCYTDPAMRKRLKEISEFAAKLFDEIILDDFYFTNCSCERCIQAKGDRDWVDFRRDLLRDVSENLIVKPMKAVNPKVRVIIKYPNWRESYHFTGYVPEVQKDIFDATYTGTETRSVKYTDQHLPEYLSYSLVRYFENGWPGRNGGGWFDTYQCYSIDRYLEQAYLTAFAGAKELMHFMWNDLIDNPLVAPMGLQLKKIDEMLGKDAKPCGIPVYVPFASSGENHLEMRLGMLGLPIEPTPYFPAEAKKLFLTESALADKEIIEKLTEFVRQGGDAVITTGFLREAGEELRKAGLTEARLTGRSHVVTRYHATGDFTGYYENEKGILFPEIVHGNNMSWSLLNGGDGDYHATLFLRSTYGKGRLYVMGIPENDSDLNRMPTAAIDVLKSVLSDGEYYSGKNFSAFTYEDGSVILYRYVKEPLRSDRVTIHTDKEVTALVDVASNRRIPAHKVVKFVDFRLKESYEAEVMLSPGTFRKYQWETTTKNI
ncbi:MAG: hypothetical protein J6Z33_12145 [Lachnospiraceae bacterium]|nr:hypothetical protein [Lachnospiraceae bacterium]